MALSDIKSLQKRIRSGVRKGLYPDRRLITGELRAISNTIEKGKDGEGTLAKLRKLEKRLNTSIKKRAVRRNHLPEITYPGILPITKKKMRS